MTVPRQRVKEAFLLYQDCMFDAVLWLRFLTIKLCKTLFTLDVF